jgi:uncharacterized protein YbjT (DUF2867 family)
MSKLKVLVTGATGTQGGGVARLLLANGHHVRALTRNPASPAATALRDLGAEVVAGNFENPASLVAAARGMDTAFAMSTPYVSGPEAERAEALTLIEALRTARVGRIVYSSVSDADRKTGIPHFESKVPAEEAVKASGAAWSIVAPVFFMENITGPWWLPALQSGTWSMPMPADRKLQMIAAADLAKFTALVIEQPGTFNGRRINLASDEVSPNDVTATIARAANRTLAYQAISPAALREQNADFAAMFEWFDRVGYSADIAGLRRDYPSIGWHTFESWAKAQPWEALLEAPVAS